MLSLESTIDPDLTDRAKRRIEKKRRKRERALLSPEPMKPGVVYIGHIPHGFYETEMKAYFTQFGAVKKVKLARSKKVSVQCMRVQKQEEKYLRVASVIAIC